MCTTMQKRYFIPVVGCLMVYVIVGLEYGQSLCVSSRMDYITSVTEIRSNVSSHGAIDLSNWMAKLPSGVLDKTLNELAIPGTHDSFSYTLDPTSELGPRLPKVLKLLFTLARSITYHWCVTQDQTVYQQLESGVRYLDLRVANRPGYTELFFVHGFYGKGVEAGLWEIDKFLEEHLKEVVIIDFHQFHNMSVENHRTLIETIRRVFGNKLCENIGVQNLTLDRMWENRKQVVVIYYHKISRDIPVLWPADVSVRSRWNDTHSVPELLRNLNTYYLEDKGPELYVYQAVLAPDIDFVLGHLYGSIKTDLANKALPATLSWLRDKSPGTMGVNVCIADFTDLEGGAFVREVVMLNY